MSDQADSPVEQTAAPAAAPALADTAATTATPDPIMARLDELAASVSSLRTPEPAAEEPSYSLQDLAYPQAEPAAADGEPAQDYGYQDPDTQAWEQIQQTIQQQVQAGIQQAVTPMRIQQQAAALEQEFPELSKPEVATRVVNATRQMAERMGQANNLPPEAIAALSRDPQMVRLAYLAERATSQAAQETPVGGAGAHLEGASAQVDAPEEDFMDRIVNAKERNSFWT